MRRLRRGLKRPRYIEPGDTRSAMRRLLESAGPYGVEVHYDAQWKTFSKAVRLGYITDRLPGQITEAGKRFLDSEAR